MVALKIWAPVVQYLNQATVADVGSDEVERDICESHACHGAFKHRHDVVVGQLAIDPDVELPSVLLELPCVDASRRRKPKVYCDMIGEILRGVRRSTPFEICR